MQREPGGKIGDDPHHGRTHRRQRVVQAAVVPQGLDVGCAREDEHEARQEDDPQRHHRPQDSGHQRRQRARRVKRGEEAHELQDEDQWTGGGLGQAEPGRHVGSGNPAEVLHGLLSDVGQGGVGTTETQQRSLGEQHCDLRQDMISPETGEQQTDQAEPQNQADSCRDQRATGCRLRYGLVLVGHPVLGRPPAHQPPHQAGSDDHDREGHCEEEQRREGSYREHHKPG